ncbi:hypothetical protein LMG26857_03398 [Achromobacter anxifer]|nr:hypothetical protein LMG26857_03398 [Achromobacter anxifer]
MQMKEILLGIPVLGFIFWIIIAPLPQDRIARTCQPIHWVGNLATSTTALSVDKHTTTAARWSDKLNYSCQYLIWRLFYQDDYNKAVSEGRVKVTDEDVKVLESPDKDSDAGPDRDPSTGEIPGAAVPKDPRKQDSTAAEKAGK